MKRRQTITIVKELFSQGRAEGGQNVCPFMARTKMYGGDLGK